MLGSKHKSQAPIDMSQAPSRHKRKKPGSVMLHGHSLACALYARVIIRSPYIGREFMRRSQYKQMVGRAGRSGLCRTGESVMIVQHKEKERASFVTNK